MIAPSLRRPLLLASLLLAAPAAAPAGLVWEKTVVSATVPPGEKTVVVRVPFKNSGPAAVRVLKIRTDCGCTKAETDRPDYAADAAGELVVEYTASGSGRQRRQLHVETDEPGVEARAITLIIDAPDWLQLAPRLQTWPVGSDPAPAFVTATVPDDIDAEITRVVADSPAFAARLHPAQDPAKPRVRQVEITPADTSAAARGTVSVFVRFPSGKELEKKIHVRIR